MKELNFDILGEARSQLEIENYNKVLKKRSLFLKTLAYALLILAVISMPNTPFFDWFWVTTTSKLFIISVPIFLMILGGVFMAISFDIDDTVEFFISPDK